MANLKIILQRIHMILQNHPGESADWIASILDLFDEDENALYQQLNSKRLWGGACSIANQALSDNPGIDAWLWQMEIREFRELMIELGQHLLVRGNAYPDVPTWLLAFNNWNQSDI